MTLAPDLSQLGLWRNQTVAAGAPGVHAFIVGISAYKYLPGGSPPPGIAFDTIPGMGQLAVSAATAAQVFGWLRKANRFAGRDVLSARLLLAPGASRPTNVADGETEDAFVRAITGGHYAEPTFANISAGVQAWADQFYATRPAIRSQSAALFFFAGHGLEVFASPSLLANDILDPGSGAGASNAIAYKSILDALPTYGLGDGIFLFDCCRNAPDAAKKLNIQGQPVLRPLANAAEAPQCMMWLKAAEQNMKSYQDPNSARRASLFGQAILEGLEGFPPDYQPYDVAQTPWRLVFEELESFAKDRVRKLLQDQNAVKVQTVIAGGDPYVGETVLAELDPPDPIYSPPTFISPPGDVTSYMTRFEIRPPRPRGLSESAPPRRGAAPYDGGDRSAGVMASFDHFSQVAGRGDAGLDNAELMHDVFGHETFTYGWIDAVRVQGLRRAQVAPSVVNVTAGRSADAAGVAWVDLEVQPGLGDAVFISLNSAQAAAQGLEMPASLAVLIPRDQKYPMPVRLECTFAQEVQAGRRALLGLSARLGPTEVGSLADHIWGGLFAAQRDGQLYSLARAADSIPPEEGTLEDALAYKSTSPLAAAVGAASLLQLGAIERVHDWPRNLANWFEDLPDGPILWAETLLRRWRAGLPSHDAVDDPVKQAAQMFAQINERGVPFLGPVLEIAANQAQFWRARLDQLSPELQRALSQAIASITSVTTDIEPEGLFLSFRSELGAVAMPIQFRGRPRAVLVTV